MDPLSALLLAMWIASYFTRNIYQDAVFRARGEDPPSFRRQQARWERRQAREDRRGDADGPGRAFWRNVWADAVASADERRERAAAKAADKRRRKWADKDLEAAEDDAYEINDRLGDDGGPATLEPPLPGDQSSSRCPHCFEQTKVNDTTGLVEIVHEPHCPRYVAPAAGDEDAKRLRRCHFCGNEFPFQDVWPARVEDETVDACHPCWDAHNRPGPAPGSVDDPEATEKPESEAPRPTDPEPGEAEIIQFADWQRPAASESEKESDLSAEITGLQSAIAYAEGCAAAAERAATQDEMAIANLHAGGTTGAAIASLQASMEGHTQNAGHYRAAAAELTSQIQVKEAYEANQGAGTREFVKSE